MDGVTAFIPGGKLLEIASNPAIDLPGAIKGAVLPGPDWDKTMGDINKFRQETWRSTEALIISALYESGRLGPKEQVLVEMRNIAGREVILDEETGLPDKAANSFFSPPPPEGIGAILPYGAMTPEQKGKFREWLTYTARDNPVAREALQEAQHAYDAVIDDMDTR